MSVFLYRVVLKRTVTMSQNSLTPDQANLAVVQAFYASIFIGDWAGVQKCLSKNFEVLEADSLPYGGRYVGLEALQGLFGQVVSYWDDLKIEPQGLTSGDGYVIGLLQFSGTSKRTGQKVSMPIAEVVDFEDGLISRIRPIYWDTKTLSEAIGA